MTRQSTTAALLIAFAAFALVSLLRGAPYLEHLLPGGLPLGNLLSALGLCALPGAAVALSRHGTALRTISVALLCCAALWLPVSVLVAGNLQLNFDGRGGSAWLAISAAIFVGSCLALLWALGAKALSMIRGAGAA